MGNPNPFSDFDDEFKNAEKAVNSTPGRIPEGTYKFVLTSQDIKQGDETVAADHEFFVANSGTRGFKLFCEVLDPESVPNPKTGEPHITKGVVVEHVFWGSVKNMPFIKRDLSTILARDFLPDEKVSEVMANSPWAGRTFEGVVRDETYQGRVSSRIAFINPWQPPAEGEAEKKDDASKAKAGQTVAGKTTAAAGPAKGAAASAATKGTTIKKGTSDF